MRLRARTTRRSKRRATGGRPQTDAERREVQLCHPDRGAAGFIRFCERHVRILDAVTKRPIPFRLFPGQRRVVEDLVAGRWLLQLKGRQLGFTTLWAVYILWRVLYARALLVVVICQERQYAEGFLQRMKYTFVRLPACLRPALTTDNVGKLAWGPTREVSAAVGSDKAARSVTGDIVLYDEASRVPEFARSLGAAQPALEVSGGQVGVLTTSAGPSGDFHTLWEETYGDHGELLDDDGVGPSGFKLVFLHWSERPGRDEAWYQRQKVRLDAISPVAVKQEYPNTPEEAFEYAEGRVYPLFTRDRCIGDIVVPYDAALHRAVDWGEAESAYVVLWIAHLPGPPGFLVSPSCPHTIREFLAYRWDENGKPVKRDDHTCDALRYAVVRFKLHGLVYVYREVYRKDSVAQGWSLMREIEEIQTISGWERAPSTSRDVWIRGPRGERCDGTVADRNWGKAINEFKRNNIPCKPSPIIRRTGLPGDAGRDDPHHEVLEGIKQVAALIDGSIDIEKRIEITRQGAALEVYYKHQRRQAAVPHAVSIAEQMIVEQAKRLLAAQRRRR